MPFLHSRNPLVWEAFSNAGSKGGMSRETLKATLKRLRRSNRKGKPAQGPDRGKDDAGRQRELHGDDVPLAGGMIGVQPCSRIHSRIQHSRL